MAFRPPASITNTLRRVGTSLRTDSILSRCPSSSAMASVTLESLKIQLTWLAELVSYTGTVTAPMDIIAISSAIHSQRVRETIATESPLLTPSPIRPLARSMTMSRNTWALYGCQVPSSPLYSIMAPSGSRLARLSSRSNRLTSLSIGSLTGLVNCLTIRVSFMALSAMFSVIPPCNSTDATKHARNNGLSRPNGPGNPSSFPTTPLCRLLEYPYTTAAFSYMTMYENAANPACREPVRAV